MTDIEYQLAPGLEVVDLGEGRYMLRSDFVAVQLSGETATVLAETLLAALRKPCTLEQICTLLPDYRREGLRAQVESFVEEGVLVVRGDDHHSNPSFAALLDEMGFGAAPALAMLTESKVAIFGLEAHGAHAAQILADAGVGHLVLVDPHPFEASHYTLTPVRSPRAIFSTRQDAVARLIAREGLEVSMADDVDGLTRDEVHALVDGCRLILVCWDRGFHAAHHWANEAAQVHGVPALFSELRATSSIAGPFFMPERSACWMCYRMRTLAAEKDFDLAMAYEEHLDRKRVPSLAQRAVLPALPAQLGAHLALEGLKYLLRLNHPTLVDKILVYDGLSGESQSHPVLVKPFCPTCAKKKRRESPGAASLIETADRPTVQLPDQAEQLVSEVTGIVVNFSAVQRDATEPATPHVWRARLSNHCFLPVADESHLSCSGKGMTLRAAWGSCLGEAVERYSGGVWDAGELLLAARRDVPGPSLDPRDLVLYREEQYATLPYAPYEDETRLRWVEGRSLISGEACWLPAIGVFMEYQVHAPEEYIAPVTSNGLAAGSTLADAVLSAVHEVVERDAILVMWLNQLPATRYSAAEHPSADVRQLARSWSRRGVELALYRVPTDHPIAVFMAVAYQRGGYGGPYATVGMGADLDPARAARAAALEVGQVRPAFRERCRTHDVARIRALVAEPTAVKGLEDHALLYADAAMAHAFDFLDGGVTASWEESRAADTRTELAFILDHFRGAGQDVLYVNLTTRDLEPLGLFAARAVIPGFQPIWFGHGEQRLGGRRAFELPTRLGLRSAPADVSMLNPLPHPIA